MQMSEDLREVIQVIYEQMVGLNINVDGAGFALDFRESDDWNIWNADAYTPFPTKIHIPYFDHRVANAIIEAKNKGVELVPLKLTIEERNTLLDHVFKYAPASPEAKEVVYNTPGFAESDVLLKNVLLFIHNYAGIPYTDAENAILIRFGKVFEQTYTRFNDLKKAEAQALEAIKRASVDRVRAEIASMRTMNDLQRITPLIWNELTTLGIPFTRCGVFIMDEARQEVQTMLSTPGGKAIATLHVPFEFDLSIITNGVQYWRRKEIYKEHWDRTAFTMSWSKLASLSGASIEASYAADSPESLHLHLLPFLQGMLYVGNDATLTEDELNLVQNLADAFATAYARYEDFNKLEAAKKQVDSALNELQVTQKQLIQSEKMASLGELTAGIAHEIQNPLNFVNNFSEVNKELLAELNQEIEKGNYEEVKIIAADITGNEEKISHHGKRADSIVKGMLQHSRSTSTTKEITDINALADEYLRLSYHGLRAKDKSFNATLKTDFDETIGKISIIPQDIGRVLLNLYNNAFYAANEKQNVPDYEPTVTVKTIKYPPQGGRGAFVEIRVTDNGPGIPQKIIDKIFQPFFTTKPTGQGTGLGLSLAYDIVKAHGGEIRVETLPTGQAGKAGEGTTFIIQLTA
jgi:signal transduction histidine kinase